MGEKNNIPQIRFKKFEDNWKKLELFQIVDLRSGRDYKHLTSGNIPVYGTGGYMLSVNKALSYNEDAIGIGRKGTIDKPYILKAPFWTVDTLFYAVPRNHHSLDFIHAIFQNINWKHKDESTGVPSLSKVAINNITTYSTSINEQSQIGTYFQNLDKLITLQQQKHDKLVTLKKAMLDKMFPEEGADVPEIRFKGFAGVWEERKLGEISESYSGGTPSVGISEFYNGNIPFIRSAEINCNSTELYITELGLRNSSAKLVNGGCILYALYGATSGEVGRSKLEGAINQAILAIKPSTGIDAEFITQWLRKKKKVIISTYLQGGQGNLSGSIVKNLNINLPCFEEQSQIGSYFQNLDKLISLHQQEIQKLKNIKKACLEKMFV